MGDKIKNSHDKLFRDVYSDRDTAKSFLENHLPEKILSMTDLSSLEICKDSFIDKDLKDFYSDMLYRVELQGESGYIYFLFEHKSYYDKWIHLQLLEYMIKIWRQDIKNNKPETLPMIIPMVLYHGKSEWRSETTFSSFFLDKGRKIKEFLPEFKFILYNLNVWSDDEIKGSVMNKAVMLMFKHIFEPDLREKLPEIFALFKNLSESKTGLQYFESLIRYLLGNVDGFEIDELKSIISNSVDKEKGEALMTIAEKLRQEGRQKGRQEGRQELIWNMKKNNISDEDIARFTSIDIDLVKKIINKEKVEIPLHLLGDEQK
jgi:predicted transposase/invertase (TIGR01784 family)